MEALEYDRSIWQNAKWRECGNPYIPRNPTETPLYRLVYTYREEFEYNYERLFEQRFGPLLSHVLKAFDSYLNCGIFWHGCARLCCEDCGHSELLAYSCKARNLCPSCDAKRAHIFAETLEYNILPPHPVRHLVWTIPKRIRPYFQSNRELRGRLFLSAWETWKEYCAEVLPEFSAKKLDAKSGSVMSLHTSGSTLNFHPHLHGMHLDGLKVNGEFHQLPQLSTDWLEERFAQNLMSSLESAGVISEEVVDSMQSWEHSGFNVHGGKIIEPDDQEARLFVARYLLKCPVSLDKIELIEEPLKTTVRYYKEADDSLEYRDFSPLEFLAAIAQNVPGINEQIVFIKHWLLRY